MCQVHVVKFTVILIVPLQKFTVPILPWWGYVESRCVLVRECFYFFFSKYITPFSVLLSISKCFIYFNRPKDVFSYSCMYRRRYGFPRCPSSVLFSIFSLSTATAKRIFSQCVAPGSEHMKFKGKGKVHSRTGHEGSEGRQMEWVVNVTARSL